MLACIQIACNQLWLHLTIDVLCLYNNHYDFGLDDKDKACVVWAAGVWEIGLLGQACFFASFLSSCVVGIQVGNFGE